MDDNGVEVDRGDPVAGEHRETRERDDQLGDGDALALDHRGTAPLVMRGVDPAAVTQFGVVQKSRMFTLKSPSASLVPQMLNTGPPSALQSTGPMESAVEHAWPSEAMATSIVATVASKSAGPGTRKNIDEFTRTTAKGVEVVGGARRGKAIIIINPAEPPLIMRDTIHCLTVDAPKQSEIVESARQMVQEVQKYVPGYQLVNGPVFDGNRVSMFMQVQGLGDYLPKYAGNLDIMTAAALRTAELFGEEIANGTIELSAVGA